ncbi:hypothetical protein DFH09DRAFT_1088959 [Mycena vulgaris]|nr:hypothetical protein DFH09DRAFT_1088959 [Mycena vulgaris]
MTYLGTAAGSSGYFIYVSTYRPTQRLAAILAAPASPSQSPFAALDALYMQILCAIPETPNLVPILRVIYRFSLEPGDIEALLELESGDVELSIRGLHSVIRHDGDHYLRFIHASFSDFLNDPSRAGEFYIADTAGLEDLAPLVLAKLGYMHEDSMKNRAPCFLGYKLGFLLKQVAPSDDLVHLFRQINHDFIVDSDSDVDPLRVEPPPNDLVQIWEDFRFLRSTGIDGPVETLSEQQSARLMDQLAECPLLLRILHAYLWVDDGYMGLSELRYLLNVSWCKCRLRPIFGQDLPDLHRLALNISIDLAFGCIRVRKQIETGYLPEIFWDPWIQWGRLLRASPCSAELLSTISEFVPPPKVPNGYPKIHQERECREVIEWLKMNNESHVNATLIIINR